VREEGEEGHLKGGGTEAEWDLRKSEGAAAAAMDGGGQCFDKTFKSEKYSYDGKCRAGTAAGKMCTIGGFITDAADMSLMGQTCECEGVPTQKQVNAITAKCEPETVATFRNAGGTQAEFDEISNTGTTMAVGATLMDCFDTKFKAKAYK